MRRFFDMLIRRGVTAVLALSVSVCCCQAQMVVDELSDPTVESTGCTGSCCSQANETPGDHPAPVEGCKICCLKGTHLTDAPVKLPVFETIVLPDVAAELTVTAPASVVLERRRSRPLRIEPTTLLRLRCALII